MAYVAERKPKAAPDRAAQVEALAADLFARKWAANAPKTPDALARDALAAARAFYRACDDPAADPAG